MHVAIAGAGIIGGSIAWRLAQRGCKVMLLDARVMGGEASWAGAGMLAPGGEVAGRSDWSEMALASAAAYPEFVRELETETGVSIDYRRGGAVEVAAGESEIEELRVRVGRQDAMGIPSRAIDSGELECLAPGAVAPQGGVARLFPGDGVVDPRDVMRALRIACEKRGVTIREFSPVLRADWRGGQAVLSTSSGKLNADAAVLAAGAWNSEIQTSEAAPQTFPVRGHLLGYQLAPGALPCILRRGHTYLLQRASGLLIAGASSECVGFDRTIDEAIVDRLRTEAEELYAPLRGLKSEPWIGFRPATPSYQPEIRRLAGSSLWLACGHFRNGILLAPDTARRVADAITGAS